MMGCEQLGNMHDTPTISYADLCLWVQRCHDMVMAVPLDLGCHGDARLGLSMAQGREVWDRHPDDFAPRRLDGRPIQLWTSVGPWDPGSDAARDLDSSMRRFLGWPPSA